MALSIKHQEIEFGVGDKIKVFQRIKEGEKTRVAFFEGMVISIKGMGERKMFTVRRVGEAGVGIEKIFPISLPAIERIEVIKKGVRGVRKAKLYYIREKSTKEIDKIYWRSNVREKAKTIASSMQNVESKTKKTVKKTKKSVKKASETK